jgi:Xaa-Pro dipeptidase
MTDPDVTKGIERELPFPLAEFQDRIDRLRRRLSEAQLDAGIYFAPEDIFYLTGYNTTGTYYGFQAFVVPVASDPYFVCRRVEESNVIMRSIIQKRWVYTDTDNPALVLINTLRTEKLAGRRIELDADSIAISPRHFAQIEQSIGSTCASTTSRCLVGLRRTKSPLEIEYIRKAAQIMRIGMDAAVRAIRVGATEDEVAAACYSALILAGCEYPGMAPFVASGPRAGLAHTTWEGHRKIRQNDIVLLEVPGCVWRYHACQMRSVSVGTPSSINRHRMDVVLESRNAALSVIRPGVTADEVDRAMRVPLEKAGLAQHHLHRAGYGLGIAYPPRWDEGNVLSLRAGDKTRLAPNMVFHLLSELYFFCETLIGCTETVMVTDTGYEILTPYINDLVVV